MRLENLDHGGWLIMGTHNEAIGLGREPQSGKDSMGRFVFRGGLSHLIAESSLDEERSCG
jgi:hypothetical protein